MHKVLLFGPGLPGTGLPATLTLSSGEIVLTADGIGDKHIALVTISPTFAGFNDQQLHLHWQEEGDWTAVIKDPASIAAIQAINSHEAKFTALAADQRQRRRKFRWGWGFVIGTAIIPFALLMALLIAPEPFTTWLAERIPPAYERELGQAVFINQQTQLKFIEAPKLLQALREIGGRLTKGSAYKYQWYIVKNPVLNAYAIPGGFVVVHSGLLNAADSAEELAGVLAHEVQHVERHHSLKNLLNKLGITTALTLILGDTDHSVIAYLTEQLSQLKYSREQEREADSFGLQRLRQARIDPQGMLRIFDKLQKQSVGQRDPEILSTHPNIGARIETLKQKVKQGTWPKTALLPYDWPALKTELQRQLQAHSSSK